MQGLGSSCFAQLFQASPSRFGARFGLGDFVFVVVICVRRINPRARLLRIRGVGPLRIVHGEAAYHFDLS
ncbi:hypothetical protein MCNS_45230 [Mycobacterium conspicuum]|uniref:Uncharacterized protein n=1 Tax=Mycobacterium conspicuum TaxID=44010 RepID=A0A7I7YI15_9MYCO|nr:hypothetical protein MCNS_45230 [Mycobacterium conspicuum]